MNIEQARDNMLLQQLRINHVFSADVLDIVRSTPRQEFVPAGCEDLAFADMRLPIGHDETMMTPMEEGKILQAVNLTPDDRVLEIGTGTGYLTALLARQAKHVLSLDIYPEFTDCAKRNLQQQGIQNVTLITADGSMGWEAKAPYDVIVITGALPQLPRSFMRSLSVGGRLFAIVGKAPVMTAVLWSLKSESQWQQTALFDTNIKTLENVKQDSFEF